MFEDNDVVHRVWMLLGIVHKAESGGPHFKVWSDLAYAELDRIAETYKVTPIEPEPELPLEKKK